MKAPILIKIRCRETLDQRTVSLKAGDALIDPLVIDLSGAGVSFSNVKFEFDLAAKGSPSLINAPGAGLGNKISYPSKFRPHAEVGGNIIATSPASHVLG